jgi:class 3 adenylate cyclase
VSDLDGVAEPGAWVLGRIFSGLDQGNWFAYALVDLGEPAWSDTADTEMPPEMAQLLREEVGRTLGSVRIVHGSAAELAYAEPAGAVDLVLALIRRSREEGGSARGGVHFGRVPRRDRPLGGRIARVAAELGDRARRGQLLVTGAVLTELYRSDLSITSEFHASLRLGREAIWVYEVKPLDTMPGLQ